MEIFWTVLLFLLGVALIVKGGDWFVDAASWIAEATGIPHFVVGATVVSFATTLPEMIVSVVATAEGKIDMAIGNAVGSVTANTGLILAVSLLCIPCAINRKQFGFKGLLLMLSCVVLFALCAGGGLNVWAGLLLVCIFAAFMIENVHKAKRAMFCETRAPMDKRKLPKNLLLFVIGAACIVFGADLLVDNGSELARILGVPESIIGLTFVAVGTSLPELVTTVTAIVKKQSSLSVGNIVGANIIDLALILPVCSWVSGGTLPISHQTLMLDIPVCFALICVAIVPALFSGRFGRWQGVLLLGGYAAYVIGLAVSV